MTDAGYSNENLMRDARFVRVMAVILLVMTFAGFAPRYLIPLVDGTYAPDPMWNLWMHPHAIAGFGFSVIFILQPTLIAQHKFALHRTTGRVAAALVALSVASGLGIQLGMYPTESEDLSNIMGGAFRVLQSLPMMAGFFLAAWAHRKRPDWHWRFMYMSAYSAVGTILGRIYLYYLPVPEDAIGPLVGFGNLIAVLVLPVSDKIRHGKIHGASWISLGVFIFFQVFVMAALASGWWVRYATSAS